MAKAYWVVTYRSIKNADAFQAYGMPTKVYEAGINQRVVVIEFDDIAKATSAHDAPDYQAALKLLGDGVDRDIRIVEGVA